MSPDLVAKLEPLIGLAIGGVVTLWVLLRLIRWLRNAVVDRGKSLSRWARGVRFSAEQLSAMRSLWQWYRSGRRPVADPLQQLSASDMSDLMRKCEVSYLPKRLWRADEQAARDRLRRELTKIGMGELEAHIVVGMKFGKLGAANDLSE